MLGSAVIKVFEKIENVKIHATYREKNKLKFIKALNKKTNFIKFDIEKDSLSSKFKKKNYDVIINCAGVIKPYIKEKDNLSINRAIKINSIFPYDLYNYFKNKKIFQIATDCTYDGNKGNYIEESKHNPTDEYGKTKSLGEVFGNNFYNLRCSIIGKEIHGKNSFLEWVLSQNKKKNTINGFVNHKWNGLTTDTYAELIKTIILKEIKIPTKLHLIPKDKVSKYVLVKNIIQKFNLDNILLLKSNNQPKCNRDLSTSFQDLNLKIWKKSKFKKQLTIKEMISNL